MLGVENVSWKGIFIINLNHYHILIMSAIILSVKMLSVIILITVMLSEIAEYAVLVNFGRI